MFRSIKIFGLIMITLVIIGMSTGCNENQELIYKYDYDYKDELNYENESVNAIDEENLISKEEAFRILLEEHLELDYHQEIIEKRSMRVDNYEVYGLDDIQINGTTFHRFEKTFLLETTEENVSFNISSKTGKLYYDIPDAIINEFNLGDFDYEIIHGEKFYMVEIQGITDYTMYISINGEVYENLEDEDPDTSIGTMIINP